MFVCESAYYSKCVHYTDVTYDYLTCERKWPTFNGSVGYKCLYHGHSYA